MSLINSVALRKNLIKCYNKTMLTKAHRKQITISAVIAAYNEEPRIETVLKVVEKHPLLQEVIVVDDGSKDHTAEVVKRYQVKLIQNKQNLGKTLSVKKGIQSAHGDLILLLDADLKNLTKQNIEELVNPVISGKVDWTISLRGNSTALMKLLKMDWVSGERAVPKKLLLDPLIWSRPDVGYGLETLMNKSLLANKNLRFCSIYLPNLLITKKSEKIGKKQGWKDELKMIKQITKVLPLRKVVWQFLAMANLNRKFTKNYGSKD